MGERERNYESNTVSIGVTRVGHLIKYTRRTCRNRRALVWPRPSSICIWEESMGCGARFATVVIEWPTRFWIACFTNRNGCRWAINRLIWASVRTIEAFEAIPATKSQRKILNGRLVVDAFSICLSHRWKEVLRRWVRRKRSASFMIPDKHSNTAQPRQKFRLKNTSKNRKTLNRCTRGLSPSQPISRKESSWWRPE